VKLVNPANKRKLHGHRGRHRAGRRRGRRDARPSSATTSSASATRTARAARTRSPRRAASTPPRTTERRRLVYRLFYDTVKGGDFRARESNVYRLAEVSVNIIDQCVAQGVPFAREYGGLLDNRSFGGAQVSRTFYARGQTGQQLLLGAYQALERQIAPARSRCSPARDARPRSSSTAAPAASSSATWSPARSRRTPRDAVVLATGGYGNVFYLSTNAKGCNVTATWRAHKRKGALFANPCYTQIHPTCIPVSPATTSRSSR
jgi:succinate dehydrogenase / fumarate reductase flavoprotein subunit